jgi:hypothetical protein
MKNEIKNSGKHGTGEIEGHEGNEGNEGNQSNL